MKEKNIFIFDQNKCVGCHACVVACMNENGFQIDNQWRNVYSSQFFHEPNLPLFHLSLACNHCDDAPCMENCPALAYSRDEITGAIIHDPKKCIGCKYCTWACPFDAPKFVPVKGIIEKCTFCNHRIEENLKPACANLCPVGALDFITAEFPRKESFEFSPVKVDVGSKIKIIRLRNKKGPEMDLSLFKDLSTKKEEKKINKISALKEWPLLLFSLISAFTVSIYASGKTAEFSIVSKFMFMGFGALSAFFSMFHLGKKLRSWRSVLNVRRSWLSREIIFMILFYGLAAVDFFIFDLNDYIGIASGLLLLYSIDMLYRVANWNRPANVHSAQTLLIAFSITLFIKELLLLFGILSVLRLILYVMRKNYYTNKRIMISSIRLLLLFTPFIALLLQIDVLIIFGLLLSGEIIDRIEFYNELQVPDPAIEFVKS